ncbi:MAG: radical SAM protein [Candidatus Nanoarchaeia archaeon]|nr:radical SAM protein [Candidatus Nanoarchaeia archaeon]
MKKNIIKIDQNSGIPLIGTIFFGILDRGTNLLQIRATTYCPLKCIFCSTAANSDIHPVYFEVDLNYLVNYLKDLVKIKGNNLEAHLDSVGEPAAYPKIVELVREIRKIKNFKIISMQSNGYLLNEKLIKELENAGLDRINVSIQSLDQEKANYIAGINTYDVEKLKSILRLISKSKIKLMIAPVYVPGINDEDIEEIIKFAKEINAELGIQKYEVYKLGRKPKGVKKQSWYHFDELLNRLSKKYEIKLKLSKKDFLIEPRETLPIEFKENEIIYVDIKSPGWLKNQMIGVAKNRSISVENCNANLNDRIKVKIISNKHNIYVAKQIK